MEKYPNKLAIICEKYKYANNLCPLLKKIKFLLPKEMTIYEFIIVICKQLNITNEQSITLFVNGFIIMKNNSVLLDVYNKYKNADGFLYFIYNIENTFG
jgi:hypothetical protein